MCQPEPALRGGGAAVTKAKRRKKEDITGECCVDPIEGAFQWTGAAALLHWVRVLAYQGQY